MMHRRFQLESGEQPDFLKVIVGVVDREGNYIGKKASSVYKVLLSLLIASKSGPKEEKWVDICDG